MSLQKQRGSIMKGIIGYYNACEYRIELVENGNCIDTLYTAGNSPHDSQQYTAADDGVGLKTMRQFCKQTAKEIAVEHDVKFIGVERLEEG